MQARVQYAKTRDGVSIAYSCIGRGPPVVFAPTPCEAGPAHPRARSLWDDLARRGWGVVHYDPRGMGLSDRDAAPITLDGLVLDLEAAADRAASDRFCLVATSAAAAVAVTYATWHPGRVSRLVLRDPFPSGADWALASPMRRLIERIAEMAEDDWSVFTLAIGSVVTNFEDAEEARAFAAQFSRTTSPKTFLGYETALRTVDLEQQLALLDTPTLVVSNPAFPVGTIELSRRVATLMPHAEFVIAEGDGNEEVEAIAEFLRAGDEAGQGTSTVPVPASNGHLTPRETEVLRLIARGRTNREIATDLVLSERTVARHITNLYGKLGLRSKAEATAYAFRHRLT